MKAFLALAAALALALSGCGEPKTGDITTSTGPPKIDNEHGAITGLLLDDLIRPVPGALILLQEEGATATTAADGTFGFGDLAPGRYTLRVEKEGHASTTAFVDVRANKYSEVEVQADRLANDGSLIVTEQYSIFTPCAASTPAYSVVHGYCFYDASGDSYRPGLEQLNYTGFANVTYLVAEVVINQADNYDWVIRHDDGSSFGGEEYGSARIDMGTKGKVILQLGTNYANATQPDNAVWKNDKPLAALAFYLGQGGNELETAGCSTGVPEACDDYFGVGHKMAIEGNIVMSLFLGKPQMPIEEYCTITC